MDMALFTKIADECAALGITHVRMHNYGEAFVDRRLVEKVRYAKSLGIQEVGLISNGSLITEEAARGMVDAGLDAINISVDAAGKEVFETTRVGLKYDKVVAERRAAAPDPCRVRQAAAEADSVVRPPEQFLGGAGVHRALGRESRQDPHHGSAQLGRHVEPRVRRQLPVLPPLAHLHCPLGRTGVAVLRRLRRPARFSATSGPRRSRTSGTPRPTARSGGITSITADPTSVSRATSPRRTPRSGSRSSVGRLEQWHLEPIPEPVGDPFA